MWKDTWGSQDCKKCMILKRLFLKENTSRLKVDSISTPSRSTPFLYPQTTKFIEVTDGLEVWAMHWQRANVRFCSTEWRQLLTYTFRYFWIWLKTRALQILNFYRKAYSFILWQFDILTLFLGRSSVEWLHLSTSGFTNRLITLQRVPCGM